MDVPPDDHAHVDTAPVCYRHTDRVTYLSCSNCGRSICADCSYEAAVGQRCPDCTRQLGRTRVVRARDTRTVTPVVGTIIGIAVVAYLLQRSGSGFTALFIQDNDRVATGEIWRLFTAAFLHGSVIHIGFNMYALYLFGPPIERRFGTAPFVALYTASALVGGVTYLYTGGLGGLALGASGAIFGLFGTWFAASYQSRHTPAGAAQFRSLLMLLGINLALPFIAPNLNIAWEAHVGGLVTGVGITLIWMRLGSGRNVYLYRTLVAGAIIVIALAAAIAF
jgi:membrane associated rhomboid family serine protease